MSVIRFFTARTHGRRAQWWISFALFTLLMGAWAVAQPYNAGPDELAYFLVLVVLAFWLWSSAADPDRRPERELLHQ